jgi:hypothetical protein
MDRIAMRMQKQKGRRERDLSNGLELGTINLPDQGKADV